MKSVFIIVFLLFTSPSLARAETELFFLQAISMKEEARPPHLEISLLPNSEAPWDTLIQNGAVYNLSLRTVLEKINFLRPNSKIQEDLIIWQVRFDPLTREYLIVKQGEAVKRKRQLLPLLQSALEDVNLPLNPEVYLLPDTTYKVSVNISLDYAEIPQVLEKTLFFMSWRVGDACNFLHEFTTKAQVQP